MKAFMVMIGVLALAAGAFGEPLRFDISAACNKDVVYEGGGNGTALPFGGNPEAVHCFGEAGFMDGLPKNRLVSSSDAELGMYLLRPYDADNVIELNSLAVAESQDYVIDVPDRAYAKIGLLVSAVDGDCSFTLKVRYEDGTVDTLWWEADDWYDLGPRGNLVKAVRDMDRVEAATGKVEDSNHFNLYEFILDEEHGLKPQGVVLSLSVGNDPNRWPNDASRYGGVFAINGAAQ